MELSNGVGLVGNGAGETIRREHACICIYQYLYVSDEEIIINDLGVSMMDIM